MCFRTPFHVVEPKYPGVCEQILNFGEFWRSEQFEGKAAEILEVTEYNRRLHRTASRYMNAAGQLINDNFKLADSCTDKGKLSRFADALCRRYIPKKGDDGREWVRFIEGITPLGVVAYTGTVSAMAGTVIPISDEFGSVSRVIMAAVRDYALTAGYEIITLKSPFLPDLFIDHVIIPELSLAFVRENGRLRFETDERRIHARRFVNSKQLHLSRKRIHFNQKAAGQLLLSAAHTLNEAKQAHDKMEAYYIDAMDFGGGTRFATEFCEKIFG